MPDPMLIARCDHDIVLLPNMANRHGLIAGATGTGKTVTLQVIAEGLSKIGVPVFMADVKGDLAGISQPGTATTRVAERITQLNLGDYPFAGCPVVFWDVLGEGGHPIRTTVSEMGPLLLARMLNLNETQEGVLHIVFKIADDNGMLLLDLKDLRAMLQYAGDNQADFKTQYGNISAASVGAIQRGLLTLESQSGEKLFGEPALDINDLIQTDAQGHGVINILVADKLMQLPQTYATLLLSILSDLYEELPEVGDPEKPKLVFFFDEAHLLFDDAPKPLLDKIEQVVRLVRSKGVGVYFVSQNPLDIPDEVLGQLGNRVQHALRAFTPRDQKAVRAAAETFRENRKLNVETVISELAVGEALISTLEDKGTPSIVERAMVVPPHSQIGAITPEQRKAIITGSVLFGHYENAVDRDSAFEMLTLRAKARAQEATTAAEQKELEKHAADLAKEQAQAEKAAAKAARQPARPRARQSDNMAEAVMKSTARAAGSQLGRSITRGILGSLFGGRK